MNDHENYIPLPKEFWSLETGAPMKECRLCGRDLMEPGTNYLIEKAFKNSETIFEHALCLSCYTQVNEEMSEESRLRVRDYFAEHVNMNERNAAFLEAHGLKHEKWISHCMVKGYPVQECGEYQLYGFCIDEDLIFSGAPYIICGEVIEELLELLSEETIGVMIDLSAKLFGINAPKDLLIF